MRERGVKKPILKGLFNCVYNGNTEFNIEKNFFVIIFLKIIFSSQSCEEKVVRIFFLTEKFSQLLF
jgi:hypothetical protein